MTKRLTVESLTETVNKECLVRNYEFLGIVGEFNGSRTKLSLHCEKHDHYWQKTNYNDFIGKRKRGCPICGRANININKRFTKEKIIENVIKKCEILNYDFLGIVGNFNGARSHLKLHCNKHDYTWNTSSYDPFINKKVGCPICGGTLKLTKEKLIENVKKECLARNYKFLGIVGEFKVNKTKLELHCNKHDYTWKSTIYYSFIGIHKCGCPICGGTLKLTKEKLIENVKIVCKKRNYQFLGIVGEFKGARTKLELHCVKHNYTWETTDYDSFIGKYKCGCYVCGREIILASVVSLTKKELIENVKDECIKRGYEFIGIVGKFDYVKTKLELHCVKHNYTWKTTRYSNFIGIKKVGCPMCGGSLKISQIKAEQYVNKKCLELNYKCNDFEYIGNSNTYLTLTCDKGHTWNTTTYASFMRGNMCTVCNLSKMEIKIEKLLIDNNINYISQHYFNELKKQSLDFYLPDFNLAIECQGIQHFKPIDFFGGEYEYVKNIERDKRKYYICKNQNIRVIYYTECVNLIPDIYYDKIFTNLSDLLNEINLN